MKRKFITVFTLFLLFVSISTAFSQNAALQAFQRNFARGSIATKIQVLQDAAEFEEMGPLFVQAVDFFLGNVEQLGFDSEARQLSILAVRLIGITGYSGGAPSLWQLFQADKDTSIRVEIMNTFGRIAIGDLRTISLINSWLSSQNSLFRGGGERVDRQVVAEAIMTLGKLGDASSFPVVFTSGVIGYSGDITEKSRTTLDKIEGDYSEMMSRVIRESHTSDKVEAVKTVMRKKGLTDEDRGKIAETALEVGLYTSVLEADETNLLWELRCEAIRIITVIHWTQAERFVIEHFNQVVLSYDRGQHGNIPVVEAIYALGAMESHEAAIRLTQYLELMNSYTENEQAVDEQIILSTIKNLGILGDQVAFDYLLYTGYLDYSDRIKKAARESLNNLQRR
jgi:hypothetical protein